ncbi:MAG: cytochrome-c peroxidase [Gammaproteobacteria bacterium]|nr:cytochrome-c peroxidase [Gammaproteobacteria bacterium]
MRIVLFVLVLMLSACVNPPAKVTPHQMNAQTVWTAAELNIIKSLSLSSLPEQPTDKSNRVLQNQQAQQLGQQLFFDTRLSANGKVACATCHQPALYFTDGLKTAQGLSITRRNTPSIVGAAYGIWFFHDGRSDSLWSQALGPIENELEHGINRAWLAQQIFYDQSLRQQYETIFGAMPELNNQTIYAKFAGPVADKQAMANWQAMSDAARKDINTVFANVGKSIAAYESKLKPAASRFDQYAEAILRGQIQQAEKILNKDEIAGLKLFIGEAMCTVCHNGPMFSDSIFHNIATPPASTKNYDWGRYPAVAQVLKSEFNCSGDFNDSENKTCNELNYIVKDKHHTIGAFKTPSLRNVSKTAPYMHAGQFESLADVIEHYNKPAKTLIGQSDLMKIKLDEKQKKQIEAFLLSLDSEIAADVSYLQAP